LDTTNLTLLGQAARGSDASWVRLERLYRPFLTGWFLRKGIHAADAEDLTQDVLTVLVKELPNFQHSGNTGAFRTWLRNMCVNRFHGHMRKMQVRGEAKGGTIFQQQMNEVEESAETQDWEREHDRHVLAHLLGQLSSEFEMTTVTAFRRVTLENATAQEVATELGLTTAAVYMAKSRVLRRLRELAADLVCEETLA